MRILILGAGAVGLSLAARLSDVCDIHAVCRKKNADAIASTGFRMTGIWGEKTYRFSASDTVPTDTRFDYIFITSKSQATEKICRQYASLLAGTETISLQNGIGNEEIICRYSDHVIGGMIITGFEWRGDAEVHVSVEAGPMKLGRFPQGLDASIEKLASLLKAAGINVETSSGIKADLWGKTLYNCSLNPLGAIMRVPYGNLTDPAAWRIIENIVREAFGVVMAEGVRLPWATADEYLAYLRDVQIPATSLHRSSMLQDITRGKTTEIDFMNGAVVQKGKQHSVPTPYNSCIVDLIKFQETLVCGEDRV